MVGHDEGARSSSITGLRLSRDYSIRFSDCATFVSGPFQAFVSDFCPEYFHRPRNRLVRMPFGVSRTPWHATPPIVSGKDNNIEALFVTQSADCWHPTGAAPNVNSDQPDSTLILLELSSEKTFVPKCPTTSRGAVLILTKGNHPEQAMRRVVSAWCLRVPPDVYCRRWGRSFCWQRRASHESQRSYAQRR